MAAGSIVVDLLMRTGSFETDTKRAQKSLKNFEKSVDDFSVKAGAGIATVATVVASVVVSTTKAAEEVQNFAKIAGASNSEFQKMAVGANSVGISTEKLADQFKDFREKFGEYLDTGGGGMKDFFENIAPKIGVTADQFRKLSGPQALQLYVSSLEKANLSQEQMSFYLESVASDTTALIPLLRDNGKAMKEMADQAEATGQIMSDDLIKNSVDFQRQMDQLMGVLKGFANAITQEFLPSLIKMADEFLVGMRNANGLFDAISKFGTINPFRSESENLKVYRAELGNLYKFRDDQVKRGGIFGSTAAVDKDIADVEAKIKYLEELQKRSFERNPTAGAGRGLINPPTVTSQAAVSFGPTAAEIKASEAAKKLKIKSEEDHAAWLRTFTEGEEKYRNKLFQDRLQAEEDLKKQQAERLAELTGATELEKQREDMLLLANAFETGAISAETYGEAVKNALGLGDDEGSYWDKWLENARAAMMSFNDLAAGVIQNFTTGFGNAFEKMVFDSQSLSDSFKNLAESMARSIVNALGQMAAEWLAYQAVQLIVGKATQASASAAQTFQAMTMQQMAAISAFASTAAIPIVGPAAAPAAAAAALAATTPFVATVASLSAAAVGARANGGPVSADAPYLVGERGPELFVPNTAGKIISNEQMNKDGGTVINQTINVTTGVQQTVRAEIISLMPQIANAAKSAVADARQRGGSYASSMR